MTMTVTSTPKHLGEALHLLAILLRSHRDGGDHGAEERVVLAGSVGLGPSPEHC